MLINRTDELIDELITFKSLQISSNETKVYLGRNDDLKKITIDLEELSEMMLLFRNQNSKVEIDLIINYPKELFTTLYKNWENDKKSIIEKNDFFRRIKWSEIRDKIIVSLQKQWEDFINSNMPNINNQTLDAFELIPDFKISVRNLKEKIKLLNEYKKSLPSSDSDFQLVISYSSEMKLLVEQLYSKDIPDSVKVFLEKAVTIGGIDLSKITTEIFEWLRENDLLDKCLVRFK